MIDKRHTRICQPIPQKGIVEALQDILSKGNQCLTYCMKLSDRGIDEVQHVLCQVLVRFLFLSIGHCRVAFCFADHPLGSILMLAGQ